MYVSEYYATMNLLSTLGFTQDKTDYTKFYLPMKGDITIVDKDNDQVRFCSILEVTLNSDTIVMSYNKYASLEATDTNMYDRLTWISCQKVFPHQVDKLISEISSVLSEIYGSTIYKFNDCGNQEYNPKTISDIMLKKK